MYVNIRGLNAKFSKLQVCDESMNVIPILTVYAETRILGGILRIIRDDVIESTNTIVVNNIPILHSTIK